MLKEIFFDKDTPKRIFADLPLIYFSVVGASITQYVLSIPNGGLFDLAKILWIALATFLVLAFMFFIYIAIYRKFFSE